VTTRERHRIGVYVAPRGDFLNGGLFGSEAPSLAPIQGRRALLPRVENPFTSTHPKP